MFYLVQFLEQLPEQECQSMNRRQCKLHLIEILDDQLTTTNIYNLIFVILLTDSHNSKQRKKSIYCEMKAIELGRIYLPEKFKSLVN
jgi:hypothetical protein